MKTTTINLSHLPLYGVISVLLSALALAPLYSYAQINVITSTDASSTIELGTGISSTTTDSILEIEIGSETEATSTDDIKTESQSSASLRVNTDGVAITLAEEVRTDNDLEVYTHNISATEEKVSDAEVESNDNGAWKALVSYQHEGKLFGLMSVTLKSKTVVEVDEDGQLKVYSKLPWWNFMVTEKNHAESEIESRIRDNATIMAAAEVEANAEVKAQVVKAMIAELNAHTYIHASINAE